MPPRRAARAAARGLDKAEHEGSTNDAAAKLRGPAAMGTIAPGPAVYSSTYGSPPAVMPTRQNVGKHANNLAGALNQMVENVRSDNRKDLLMRRAENAAAEARQKNEADRQRLLRLEEAALRELEEQERREQEEQEEREEREEQIRKEQEARARAAQREKERRPPVPDERAPAATPTRAGPPRLVSRASSEQPAPSSGIKARERQPGTALLASALSRRQQSEPPAHLIATVRSFNEESYVFGDATLRTPATPTKSGPRLGSALGAANTAAGARAIPRIQEEDGENQPHRRAPAPEVSKATAASSQMRGGRRDVPISDSDGDLSAEEDSSLFGIKRADKRNIRPSGAAQGSFARQPQGSATGAHLASAHSPRNRQQDVRGAAARPSRPAAELQQPRARPFPSVHGTVGGYMARLREFVVPKKGTAQPRPAQPNEKSSLFSKAWRIGRHIGDVGKLMGLAISFIVLSWIAIRVIVVATAAPAEYQGYRLDNRLHWYGSDWKRNFRQLVPYSLLHPLGAISDDEFINLNNYWRSHASEIAQLKQADKLNTAALQKLKRILPLVVHMELDKNGKLVVPQEFWHALKDLIEQDKDVFTLITAKDGSVNISDLQWAALKKRLGGEGAASGSKGKTLSTADIENIAEKTLSKSWENWLKSNSGKVKDILGWPAMPSGKGKMSADELMKLIKSRLESKEFKDTVVTRDEYIRHLQDEFKSQNQAIKGELAEVESRLKAQIEAVSRAVNNHPAPSTMTKQEITALVDQLVRKGISDARMAAVARSKIKVDWRENLVQQVNFFSKGTGAMINPWFTSPTFAPPKPKLWSEMWRAAKPLPGAPAQIAALERWEEEGDCWCAGTHSGKTDGKNQEGKSSNNTKPADIAVKMGVAIIPRYVVVEHISPLATLDPGSMPKDFEVWAQIAELNQQATLQAWSLSQFPRTDERHELFGHGFVKVAEFQYKYEAGDDGVKVVAISEELRTLKAATDQIIIRAVNNHGGEDHTCFYRVRMYGDKSEI